MPKEMLSKQILNKLPENLKNVNFVFLPKGFWYGLTKERKGVRLYVEKDKNGEEMPRIEMSELQTTGQMGGAAWLEAFKSLIKKK
jgi:hypothetical protein